MSTKDRAHTALIAVTQLTKRNARATLHSKPLTQRILERARHTFGFHGNIEEATIENRSSKNHSMTPIPICQRENMAEDENLNRIMTFFRLWLRIDFCWFTVIGTFRRLIGSNRLAHASEMYLLFASTVDSFAVRTNEARSADVDILGSLFAFGALTGRIPTMSVRGSLTC